MEVRNRMADVTKLRCNICQDFLKMVLIPDWQKLVYDKAKYEVENLTRFRNKYIPVYEEMRNIGIENYSVDNMDVTFMAEILHGCKDIAPVQKITRDAMKAISEDRNLSDHSNENESADELYLRGLLALCNLRIFVRTVDKYEVQIDDQKRLEYRMLYISKIDSLKNTMDDERIELIQRIKCINNDVHKILGSTEPLKTWCEINALYMNRYWKLEKNPERYYEFLIRASDAGIQYAHLQVADYFALIKKDYLETERRLLMLTKASEKLRIADVHGIVSIINSCLDQGYSISSEFKQLLEVVKTQGFKIMQDIYGHFYIEK